MFIPAKVFLGIGGNSGDPVATLHMALAQIERLPGTTNFACSPLYKTPPVSDIPQPDYVNAVCRFTVALPPSELLEALQALERSLGKVAKPKNAPRPIDIDLLFYGESSHRGEELEIPHPRWKERLFVLIPLLDLTSQISIDGEHFDIDCMVKAFPESERQAIVELKSVETRRT